MMLALMLAIPMTPHPPSSKHVCRKVSSPGRLLLAARVSIKRPNRRGPTKAVPASATLAAINANTRPRSGASRYMTRAYSRTKFMEASVIARRLISLPIS